MALEDLTTLTDKELAMRGMYRGRPCKNCGATERYRTNRGCIDCVKNKVLEDIEGIKKSADNQMTYLTPEKPCKVCGGEERYTANNACFSCHREYSRNQHYKRREDSDQQGTNPQD